MSLRSVTAVVDGPRPKTWRRDPDEGISALGIALPGGLPDAERGVLLRRAAFAELRGVDELRICEALERGAPEQVVGEILLAGLSRLGPHGRGAIRSEHLSALHAADQDVLIVELYRSLLGDQVAASVRCGDCGELFDLLFAMSDMPVFEGAVLEDPVLLELPESISRSTGVGTVLLRLPKVSDREALLEVSPEEQGLRLLRRCLLACDGAEPDGALHDDLLEFLEEALEERAPSIPRELTNSCPECGASTSVAFDPLGLLADQWTASADRLLDEVHALAWTYHWSEEDILELPRGRRARYLDRIRREVERG